MPKRIFDRTKRRIPCELMIGESRYSGLILDLSAGGFFVQTSAKVAPGDTLDLEMSLPGDAGRVCVQVEVARRKEVPARLRAVAHGGVGLRVLVAPNVFYCFVDAIASGRPFPDRSTAPTERERKVQSKRARTPKPLPIDREGPIAGSAGPPEIKKRYKVTLREVEGSRTRTLTIECDSRAEARSQALAQAGPGWEIERVLFV
jgi:hypothetical protein